MIEKTHEITYIKIHHKFKAWTWLSIFFGYPVEFVHLATFTSLPRTKQVDGTLPLSYLEFWDPLEAEHCLIGSLQLWPFTRYIGYMGLYIL